MTSLEFIMDMDTEDTPPSQTINKNDGGSISPGPTRSQDPDPSRAATSSHEKLKDSNDRLTTASTRRRGHSSRSPKPTAPSSSSLASSSSRPPPLSRRSTASSEPMDPHTYGGHIQGSSSSNMPTRPIGSSPNEGNVPVKLTPITGRVSRAKKGVPVHTCEICKPPKTFTRAEHLRRHQLSHKNPGYPCTYSGCDKAFHRADLLARHAQRHEQDDKASSRGTGGEPSRPTSAASDDRMSYMHHGMGGGSVSRPVMPGPSDMSQGGAYPGNLPSYHHSMDDPGTSSGQTPMSPYSGQRESYPSSSAPQGSNYTLSTLSTVPIISNQPPSVVGSPVSGTPFGLDILPRTSSPFSMYMDAGLPSLTIPDNSLPPGLVHTGHDGSPWPSSASESNYSTPSEISHRRNIPREYESPTSDWQNHSFYSGASPNLHSPGAGLDTIATSAPFFGAAFSPTAHNIDHALGLPMPFADDNTSFVEHPQQYHPYSSVRSPTPPTISLSAQPAETLVTLAAPISDAASMGGRQKGSTMLLGPLRGAVFLTANTLSPHVRKAIPKYLEVYWKRFDTLFPLVHRKSIKTAADEVLCCAMAAIGTQFLQGKEDRIRGNELHEFARKEVNLCAQWTLPIMQAILLCEFYARFRGRSAQRNASEPFQSLYSRMANSQIPDNLNSTSSTHDRNWNEWMEYESRRRLLAACFVLDVHTSVYYQQNLLHQFPISTLPIPLIRPTEDLWATQSQESWETLLGSRPTNTGPADLSEEPPTAEQVANAPYLDHAVFLASEALRLPRRSSPSILDLSVEVDETTTEGISRLFPGSAVGNTYLALYYTPLHDLLAVSGDTWLFSKKVASSQIFEQHKNRFQRWLGSPQATTAARFAAKALVAFLDHSNCNTLNSTVSRSNLEEEEDQDRDRNWNMSDISDYWAMYVCALICWALGLRATVRGSSGSGLGTSSSSSSSSPNPHHPNVNAREKGEREALKWLKTVAGLSADKALNVRGRKEILGVVGMVKRRLEDEALGSRSRLLVDAARTLKNLEERVNYKWF